VTASGPTTANDDVLANVYEALRAHVLTGTVAARSCGLVVLLHQGVAAWMEHWSTSSLSAKPPPTGKAAPVNADENEATLVRILASMVLCSQQQKVHA